MKPQKLLLFSIILTLTSVFVSCDNDDDDLDPVGTTSVNLLSEDQGKTLLGNSDVYIDNAFNFYGPTCAIASLGNKKGWGNSTPLLDGVAPKAAVELGKTYQVFRNAALRKFPSGKLALNIGASYYNVYVVSHIKQNDSIVGANVKFALVDAPVNGLPEYNTNIGTIDHAIFSSYEITLKLPTSDFEVDPSFASSYYYTLEYEKVGNELVVRFVDVESSDVFGFYIRIKESYTYVYGKVQ